MPLKAFFSTDSYEKSKSNFFCLKEGRLTQTFLKGMTPKDFNQNGWRITPKSFYAYKPAHTFGHVCLGYCHVQYYAHTLFWGPFLHSCSTNWDTRVRSAMLVARRIVSLCLVARSLADAASAGPRTLSFREMVCSSHIATITLLQRVKVNCLLQMQ